MVGNDSSGSEASAGGRSSIHRIWDVSRTEVPEAVQTEPAVSVNVLCLAGAVAGVASMFLPWCTVGEGLAALDSTLPRLMTEWRDVLSEPLVFSALVFIAGTVAALFFPAAFAVQSAGSILFFLAVADRDAALPYGYYCELSYGFYVGIVSSVVVFAGFLRPTGPGYDGRWPWWSRRTEVSSKAHFSGDRLVRQGLATPREAVGALRGSRPWAQVVVVAMSIITVLSFIGIQVCPSQGPVTSLDNGVVILVSGAATYASWTDAYPTLTDGSAAVNWSVDPCLWTDDPKTRGSDLGTVYLGARDLSGMVLGLELVDADGDRRVTPGDVLILTPSRGATFETGVSYIMTIQFALPRPYYLLETADVQYYWTGTDGVITFEVDGDGVASSSAEGGLEHYRDLGIGGDLMPAFLVALGSTIIGAVYYLPLRVLRRRALAARPQEVPAGP